MAPIASSLPAFIVGRASQRLPGLALIIAVGCEAAIPALRAEHHHRLALAATRDANGVLGPLSAHHQGAVQRRLDGLARKHSTCRRRTIHGEPCALEGVAHCHRLQLGCERRGAACRNRYQRCDRDHHAQ
jgi:hypothetical protein